MTRTIAVALLAALAVAPTAPAEEETTTRTYPIVDTGQTHAFDATGQIRRDLPAPGEPFFGQDAHYRGRSFRYRVNADDTVTDRVTGLVWQRTPADEPVTFREAVDGAGTFRLAGMRDWRLPSIKELYSLIDFNGNSRARPPIPYLSPAFGFRFGEAERGERIIDAQFWSSTEYVGLTMRGDRTVFGVNFADGRIKGYPRDRGPRGGPSRHFVRYVRGNPSYGENRFVDHGDGTVSDLATGLQWAKADGGRGLTWEDALAYAEKLELAGRKDWRLPNAKELQSIVDYSRAPDARDPRRRGPAIDPVFEITDPESWFWSSTTHLEGGRVQGSFAAYFAFGLATGLLPHPRGGTHVVNVHGAGAQRSDPKGGDPDSPEWSRGMGPQGDAIRILNAARAVRSLDPDEVAIVRPSTTPVPPHAPPPPGARRGPRRGPPPGPPRRDR